MIFHEKNVKLINMKFVIEPKDDGMTIKDFLRREVNPSRKLLNLTKNKPDGILVNDKRMTVRYILQSGDVLQFNYAEYADENEIPMQNEDLLDYVKIVYEDDYILCVDKPPDMPSHPSFNHLDDTLANAVTAYYSLKHDKTLRFHPVNRLDKNTSGLVLIAKDRLISAKLNELIKHRKIRKTYIAIAAVDFDSGVQSDILEYDSVSRTGRITAPIRRAHDSIIKRVAASDGDFSATDFKFLESNGEISFFEVYPITGRTHQIRVHFQAIGAPLMGDDLYPGACDDIISRNVELGEKYNMHRHALHAKSLEFEHPVTKSLIKIECGLPCDMRDIMGL